MDLATFERLFEDAKTDDLTVVVRYRIGDQFGLAYGKRFAVVADGRAVLLTGNGPDCVVLLSDVFEVT